MNKFFFNKTFILGLLILIGTNIFLYAFIFFFRSTVSFHKYNYLYNSHHYLKDERVDGGQFNFLRALGQYDAQWYLKIADQGYPKNPSGVDIKNKKSMDGLTYSFFPLYPLLIYIYTSSIFLLTILNYRRLLLQTF